jgi:ABC-type glycerol-3-phosphate transport system substrate-binding protein
MSEKVVMQIQGVWMYNFINRYTPKLQWAAAPFPYPASRPELKGHCFADMDTLVIPRGAKHPREAFEFIAYVQSQPVMEELCLSHRKNSPLRKVSESFWERHPNPYIRLFQALAYSPKATPPPKLGMWPELSAELSNCFDEVTLLKKTPTEALRAVRERVQPKLDDYLRRVALRNGEVVR